MCAFYHLSCEKHVMCKSLLRWWASKRVGLVFDLCLKRGYARFEIVSSFSLLFVNYNVAKAQNFKKEGSEIHLYIRRSFWCSIKLAANSLINSSHNHLLSLAINYILVLLRFKQMNLELPTSRHTCTNKILRSTKYSGAWLCTQIYL